MTQKDLYFIGKLRASLFISQFYSDDAMDRLRKMHHSALVFYFLLRLSWNGEKAEFVDQGAEGDFNFFHGESHPDAVPRTHSERHPDVRIDFGFVFRAPAIRIEFFRVGIIILVVVEGKRWDGDDDAFLDVNSIVSDVFVALPFHPINLIFFVVRFLFNGFL